MRTMSCSVSALPRLDGAPGARALQADAGRSPVQTVRVDAAAAVRSTRSAAARARSRHRPPVAERHREALHAAAILDGALAGWQTVSYRQNTELHVEAWHWNPQGTLERPEREGLFHRHATPGASRSGIRTATSCRIAASRATTAPNNGYSRLTDGDLATYWKSNPYLTDAFTGEDDAPHPAVGDPRPGRRATPVNAMRIAWAEPYARRYSCSTGPARIPIKQPTKGAWLHVPGRDRRRTAAGGTVTLPLAPSPCPCASCGSWMTRVLRTPATPTAPPIAATASATPSASSPWARASADGEFHDLVRHTADQDQTATLCSSIDPWHEPVGRRTTDARPGRADLFYTSGYTRGLPAMIPVAMLYGTPEDAAAQIAYLKKRGYPIS